MGLNLGELTEICTCLYCFFSYVFLGGDNSMHLKKISIVIFSKITFLFFNTHTQFLSASIARKLLCQNSEPRAAKLFPFYTSFLRFIYLPESQTDIYVKEGEKARQTDFSYTGSLSKLPHQSGLGWVNTNSHSLHPTLPHEWPGTTWAFTAFPDM